MPSPPSPSRAGRQPAEGALFAEQVVAENLKRLRAAKAMTQSDVAQRMRALSHATWSKALVSTFESHRRRIDLSELLGLALVLEVSPAVLLDPAPIGADAVDFDGPGEMDAYLFTAWLNGTASPRLRWDGEGYERGAMSLPPGEGADVVEYFKLLAKMSTKDDQ